MAAVGLLSRDRFLDACGRDEVGAPIRRHA
jgi:hypothetical protein